MKLFFLIESLHKAAGTERIATDVVNALYEKTQWEITFITVSSNTECYFNVNSHISVKSINSDIKHPLQAIGNLRKLIKQHNPDYIINVATVMSRLSIPAAMFTPTKVITWEHFNLFAGSKLGYMWRICSAALSRKTIVLTHKDRSAYPKWLHGKVQTIYNFPTPIKDAPAELASNIAISVGRLTYQKGFDMLLNVWEKVYRKNKEWKLYIVGNGEDEDKLKQQAKNLGIDQCVSFIPATPKIIELYKQASLYIMSSRFEGLPLVLIEAKQLGLPCISFDCPNGPSEVIRRGTDGDLIPLGDETKMAESILTLINDKSKIKEYGKAAYEDAKERFSKDRIATDWIHVLNTL